MQRDGTATSTKDVRLLVAHILNRDAGSIQHYILVGIDGDGIAHTDTDFGGTPDYTVRVLDLAISAVKHMRRSAEDNGR